MKSEINLDNFKTFRIVLYIFLYIFSFNVFGSINSSMLLAAIFFIYILRYPKLILLLKQVLKSKYIYNLYVAIFLLLSLSLLSCTLHNTFDLFFVKIFLVHAIQLLMGIFLIVIIKWQGFEVIKVEKFIIYAYIIQSLIQLVVSLNPVLLPYIYYFNEAQGINESYTRLYGVGVRGVALSKGVAWDLALSYGLVFLIYIKIYLSERIDLKVVLMGLALIVGIFFAGRTGFVGVIFGFIYFFMSNKLSLFRKSLLIIKALIFIIVTILSIYLLFPEISKHFINNVFPFAFEPLYNIFNNNSFETRSTNRLMEMWQQPITLKEFLIGEGYYFDPIKVGTYYKQVDIGIFKNLYYWGFVGYIVVIYYQIIQLMPVRTLKQNGILIKNNLYFFCLFLFLVIMDLKSMSIGVNKMAFSVIILIGYFYSDSKKY